MSKILVGCCLFIIQCAVYVAAKDYPVNLINQSSYNFLVEGNVIDGDMNLISQAVRPHSIINFKVWNDSWLALRARGLVTITNLDNKQQQCRFEYNNHSLIVSDELNHMDLDPGFILNNSPFCASLFTLHGDKSICRGVNNCMVINDNIEQVVYSRNKDKVLSKNLWLGTHNSVIAKHYAQGKNILNVSNVDPNQTLSLTEQLEQGVRVLELDLVDINGQLQFCHFHIDNVPYSDVCDENTTLTSGLVEIKEWLLKHPDAILFLYLDMNQPISNASNLDTIIASTLQDDAGEIFALSKTDVGDTLFLNALTPNDLIHKLRKKIIFINHNSLDVFNAQESHYVFNQVNNSSNVSIPYDRSIDDFTNCQSTFSQDSAHQSLWGLRGDQTKLSGSDATQITYNKIESMIQGCLVNYIAVDKLFKRDARISAFIDYAKGLS